MVDILGTRYITDKEASQRYGYSSAWFQKQRSLGKSPPYVRLAERGRIYYPVDETDQWFRTNLRRCEK